MKTKEQILELIKAQDTIRRVWAELTTNNPIEKQLWEISTEITKVINKLGKNNDNK